MKRGILPLGALLLCVSAIGTTAAAQTQLTIYPDQSVGVLSEDPGFGERWSETILPFGNYVGLASGNDVFCRTYLRFPLDSIPGDATVESATLLVYVDDWWPEDGSAPMSVYSVAAPWSVPSVNWDDMSAWPSLGAAAATTEVYSATAWFAWDITPLVNAWLGGAANNGLAIGAADLGSTVEDWAAARRLAADLPNTRPYLSVVYRTPPAPEPTQPPPDEPETPLLPVTGPSTGGPTDWLFLTAAGLLLAGAVSAAIKRLRAKTWV